MKVKVKYWPIGAKLAMCSSFPPAEPSAGAEFWHLLRAGQSTQSLQKASEMPALF